MTRSNTDSFDSSDDQCSGDRQSRPCETADEQSQVRFKSAHEIRMQWVLQHLRGDCGGVAFFPQQDVDVFNRTAPRPICADVSQSREGCHTKQLCSLLERNSGRDVDGEVDRPTIFVTHSFTSDAGVSADVNSPNSSSSIPVPSTSIQVIYPGVIPFGWRPELHSQMLVTASWRDFLWLWDEDPVVAHRGVAQIVDRFVIGDPPYLIPSQSSRLFIFEIESDFSGLALLRLRACPPAEGWLFGWIDVAVRWLDGY